MMDAWIMICIAAFLLPVSYSAPVSVAWCYHMPSCSEDRWPLIAEKDCNGTQQSPIDIVTADVQPDANLTPLTFTGYDDKTTLTEIKNTGTTIKVMFDHDKMHVEGGDLPGVFTSSQFHLHWGNGSAMPGSEHTVDGKQYPMELHIVNKLEHNGTTILAALGFFIEATNDTGKPESWKTLTSYLTKIANAGDKACIAEYISMDNLLPGVDRTKYYRYLGSLTTPNCREGVVWTLFKDPVKVSQDLIDLFSTSAYVHHASGSPLMVNTFRSVQPVNGRMVTSQAEGPGDAEFLFPTASDLELLDPFAECQTPEPFPAFDSETDGYY